MKWRRLCLLHTLIFFVTMATLVPRVISVETKVYVYPPVVTASVGETFTVSVKISDAVNVYSWQFKLDWNATVLDFVSVVQGDFLKRYPSFFTNRTEQDEVGTDWVVAACTRVGKYSGESGSGTLATVTFRVQNRGETSLHFYNPGAKPDADTALMNQFIMYIDFTAVDGLFTNVAGLPVPSFTYSPSIPRIGENVTFDASASYDSDGYIISYFWEFGDDTNATDPVTYHAYSEAGNYTVTLSVTDNANWTVGISKTLRVRYPHDVAIISVSPNPTEVDAGGTVTITVIVLNDGTETETFTVTVYYDGNVVGAAQTVPNLAAAQNQTLTFSWNTAGVSAKTYRIKAEASVVSDETDTANNLLEDGTVKVNPASSEPFPVWTIAIAAVVAIAVVGGALFFFMRRRASSA